MYRLIMFTNLYTEHTFSDIRAPVKLSEQCRVLCSCTACLRLGIILCEDRRWARRRRRRRGTGSTGGSGGVKERGRGDRALGGEERENLDAAFVFRVSEVFMRENRDATGVYEQLQ